MEKRLEQERRNVPARNLWVVNFDIWVARRAGDNFAWIIVVEAVVRTGLRVSQHSRNR